MKERGITLIALAITIIVLLILAGVSIQILTGDSGLLQKTTTAKEESEKAKELELIELAVSAAQVTGEGKLTTDNLNNKLQANFNNENTVTESSLGWNYKANKTYRIYKDGKTEESLLPIEYQQVEYIESTGTQYIDTGIIESDNPQICIELRGNFTASKTCQYIFNIGYFESEDDSAFTLIGQTNTLGIIMQNGHGATEKSVSSFDTNKHIYILDMINKKGIFDYNTIIDLPGNIKDLNDSYCLFAESIFASNVQRWA